MSPITYRDCGLLRDVDRDFLQALNILDLVEHRDEDVQSGFEDPVVLSHPLDDPGLLVRHEHDDRVEGGAVLPAHRGSLWNCRAELLMPKDRDGLRN